MNTRFCTLPRQLRHTHKHNHKCTVINTSRRLHAHNMLSSAPAAVAAAAAVIVTETVRRKPWKWWSARALVRSWNRIITTRRPHACVRISCARVSVETLTLLLTKRERGSLVSRQLVPHSNQPYIYIYICDIFEDWTGHHQQNNNVIVVVATIKSRDKRGSFFNMFVLWGRKYHHRCCRRRCRFASINRVCVRRHAQAHARDKRNGNGGGGGGGNTQST